MIYLVVRLKQVNGEYENTIKHLTSAEIENTNESINEFCNNIAKNFFDRLTEQDGDTFYFNGGEIAIRCTGWSKMSKEEFEICQKYMY